MDARGGIRPMLVNSYESAADRMLQEIAEEQGDRVTLKARLADVIDVDGMGGLPRRTKSYALAAHLDFVMVDKETSRGRFAVELDGRQHFSDPVTLERDALKDELCERAGLPLLRITSGFARKVGRWRVLTYLAEAFYRAEAFFEAQEQGYIPHDEPFDMGSFIARDEHGCMSFDTLDAGVILAFHQHYRTGRLPALLPDVFSMDLPEHRAVQAYGWLAVAPDRYLLARTIVRRFLFQGIGPSDLAEQLTMVEIGNLAQQWLNGEAVAVDGLTLRKAVAEVQAAIDSGGLLMAAFGDALRVGGAEGPVGPPERRHLRKR
jgi:very-short-patch-repair endonuclease